MLSFKEWLREEAKKKTKKDRSKKNEKASSNGFNVFQKEIDITDKEVVTGVSHYFPEP